MNVRISRHRGRPLTCRVSLTGDATSRAPLILPSHNKLQVCIIDGDAAVRDSLSTLMSLNGVDVTGFASGTDFLNHCATAPIHCVVCEAELPDISGLELFIRCKALYPHSRFALLMSRSNRPALELARNAGVDAVFCKPLVNRRLRDFVRNTPLPEADLR